MSSIDIAQSTTDAMTYDHFCCQCGKLIPDMNKIAVYGYTAYCNPRCWGRAWTTYSQEYPRDRLDDPVDLVCLARAYYHSTFIPLVIAIGYYKAGTSCNVWCYLTIDQQSQQWSCTISVDKTKRDNADIILFNDTMMPMLLHWTTTIGVKFFDALKTDIIFAVGDSDSITLHMRDYDTCILMAHRTTVVHRAGCDGMLLPTRFGVNSAMLLE